MAGQFERMDTENGTGGSASPDTFGRSDEEAEETVTMTPRELLTKLHTAWMNERLAPDLLPPQIEEIECMLELLRNMEVNTAKLEKKDIRLGVHKMEVDRIRYLISSYLRIRLAKIQEYCWDLQTKENTRNSQAPSLMSPEEQKFLKEYIENLESHLKNMGTQHMPRTMQALQPQTMSTSSNLDSFLFLRVSQDSSIIVDDADGREEEVSLEAGSQHIIRYRPVAKLVPSGSVDLV
ncbi:unnamed protein product [Orchesella dallaii]|uniref:DNA replication complex GINS protein SLD5 n=1 Tax=Orchesella dallaii TaxID=48710 RepID=A0ABP1PRV5_9HEXA